MSILGVGRGRGRRTRRALALAVLAAVAALGFVVNVGAWAQQLAGAAQVGRGPTPLPPAPPQGAWGEVIMANNRWMVIQNQLGQQFPIAGNAIGQFLVRWPTRLDALTAQSVVEVIGIDAGSNTVGTDHVDVFEGDDQNLVTPMAVSLMPNNRMITTIDPTFQRFANAFDIGSQNLMHGWAYPVNPASATTAARLHIVGNVANTAPLQVFTPGNNFATVAPAGNGFSITRVTHGITSYAEKGDLIFLMPTDVTARTVVLSRAVLYKKISFNQFRPR